MSTFPDFTKAVPINSDFIPGWKKTEVAGDEKGFTALQLRQLFEAWLVTSGRSVTSDDWRAPYYTQAVLKEFVAGHVTADRARFSVFDSVAGTYTLNSAFYVPGNQYDFSPVVVYAGAGPSSSSDTGFHGVLISANKVAFAWHYSPSVGHEVRFVDVDGNIVSRTVASKLQFGTDVCIATLNSAVTTILPVAVMTNEFWENSTFPDNYTVSCLVGNTSLQFSPQEVTFVQGDDAQISPSSDVTLTAWKGTYNVGNSGSPVLVPINGRRLALVGCLHTGSSFYASADPLYTQKPGIDSAFSASPINWNNCFALFRGGPTGRHYHSLADIKDFSNGISDIIANYLLTGTVSIEHAVFNTGFDGYGSGIMENFQVKNQGLGNPVYFSLENSPDPSANPDTVSANVWFNGTNLKVTLPSGVVKTLTWT